MNRKELVKLRREFRKVVHAYSKATLISIEDSAALILPGIVQALTKGKTPEEFLMEDIATKDK